LFRWKTWIFYEKFIATRLWVTKLLSYYLMKVHVVLNITLQISHNRIIYHFNALTLWKSKTPRRKLHEMEIYEVLQLHMRTNNLCNVMFDMLWKTLYFFARQILDKPLVDVRLTTRRSSVRRAIYFFFLCEQNWNDIMFN
jgi:hypothetical protein